MQNILGLAGVAVVAALFATDAAAQSINMRIGNCTIGDVVHEHVKLLNEELEKQSNNRLKGEIYVNCQLGSIARQIEGLQLGTQDFFSVPPGNAVGVDPRYQAIDAPGLFESFEHAQKAYMHPAFWDKYMQLGRDKGMTPISLWAAGLASYITLMPLRTIDDFKGRKIRVLASKMETELMNRIGATGVPIPFTEVVPSLTARMVDGARAGPVVMMSAKWYTTAKNVTVVEDGVIPIITWASNQWLDKLPADLRQVVMKAGRDISPRMIPLAVADQEKALRTMKEAGVQITQLSPDQKKEWMRRAQSIGDEFLGKDPNTRELYFALKEAAEKTRN